jgi:hypothetical protein
MDHEHVFALVETIDGANLHAIHQLALDAGFVDDIGQMSSPPGEAYQVSSKAVCFHRLVYCYRCSSGFWVSYYFGSGAISEIKGRPIMTEYVVGLRHGKRSEALTIEAEDALIAALKAKHNHPEALISYVRKSNRRGDRRNPHRKE